MKKAQGMSMNVIIIAALALLVLVVLSVVFIGKTGKWGTDVSKCEVSGGVCVADLTDCKDQYGAQSALNPAWVCDTDDENKDSCCVPLGP